MICWIGQYYDLPKGGVVNSIKLEGVYLQKDAGLLPFFALLLVSIKDTNEYVVRSARSNACTSTLALLAFDWSFQVT